MTTQQETMHELSYLGIVLEPNESVVQIIHKHWGKIIWPIIGLIAAGLVTFILSITLLFGGQVGGLSVLAVAAFLGAWYVGLVGYGLSEWYGHTHSALVITNQRLIDCEQIGLWSRRFQSVDIYQIQSCIGELDSGLGVLFNFGSVNVTAVGEVSMRVAVMPQPEMIAIQVMRAHNRVAHRVEPAYDPIHPEPTQTKAIQSVANAGVTLLMFHVSAKILGQVLGHLPAQKEPSVTFLPKTGYYEVESIVPTAQLDEIVRTLKEQGAEDLVTQEACPY